MNRTPLSTAVLVSSSAIAPPELTCVADVEKKYLNAKINSLTMNGMAADIRIMRERGREQGYLDPQRRAAMHALACTLASLIAGLGSVSDAQGNDERMTSVTNYSGLTLTRTLELIGECDGDGQREVRETIRIDRGDDFVYETVNDVPNEPA